MRQQDRSTAARWQERLQRFDASGLSVRAFCEREGVSQASFYNWRKRLAAAAQPAFQAVCVTPVASVLAIELPGGARVEVAADQLELARLVVREVARVAQAGGRGGE